MIRSHFHFARAGINASLQLAPQLLTEKSLVLYFT